MPLQRESLLQPRTRFVVMTHPSTRAVRLDGTAMADRILHGLAAAVHRRTAAGGRPPGLAVILVGDSPASAAYVRRKVVACRNTGMASFVHPLAESSPQSEVLNLIDHLNARPDVDGILVQLPLPHHLDTQAVLEAVHPAKDVDGSHPYNLGRLAAGRPSVTPCTARGVLEMLHQAGLPTEGQDAVVVGRSTHVGAPIALVLSQAGATVTVCHSKTQDLASYTRRADLLVTATGRPGLIRAAMVKPWAAVIDVGLTRIDGKLQGDVAEEVAAVAGHLSPVPGGVGPMTVAMLLQNTLEAAARAE